MGRVLKRIVPIMVTAAGIAMFATGCGFNEVVNKDQDVQAAWAEVENQYQRRSDLVPNLVSTVKGAAQFEQDTLQKVVEARSQVAGLKVDKTVLEDPEAFRRFEQAQAQLSGALARLMVVSEQYPDLKSSSSFRDLQAQLEGTENRIAVARRRYIETVSGYNKVVLNFPTMIGARIRGMDTRPTFQATSPGADQAPKVEF
ncbi:MAG: LemA family protein [Myxococcales bacterium]|nr:LemA family protein [Myxococcales bacterium]